MAKSKFSYVKEFEQLDKLMNETFVVIRLDGHKFHSFTKTNNFIKPNDQRNLHLLNHCASQIMLQYPDILLSYGQSDEYSFVLSKSSQVYQRRSFKITSLIVSLFTSLYIQNWTSFFDVSMIDTPCFDCRAIVYPNLDILKDYLMWRQVDCHVNNLYNTTFWALVKNGKTNQQAEEILRKTLKKDKHEIMFQFGINYNNELDIFKKGSVLIRIGGIVEVLHDDILRVLERVLQ